MEKMKFESKDMREELILQMEKIMPGCIAEGRNADGSIEKKVESCFWADVFWKGRKAMNFPGSGKKRVFPMQTDL